MCDYSLHHVQSRPAKVGDKLTSTNFIGSMTRGFAEPEQPHVAVCLLPGTEVAFEAPITHRPSYEGPLKEEHSVGRFRQVNMDNLKVHHDALELPDGKIVMVNDLIEGQKATVLQLPVDPAAPKPEPSAEAISEAAQVTELV